MIICLDRTDNESLIRGEILLLDFINNWDKELEEMNKGKEGKPYQYPNSFISLLAIIHIYYHINNRRFH